MSAVVFVEIEDSADVWMVQRRGETGFSFEAFEVGFLRAEFGRNDFDNNGAAQFVIDGFVDRSLTAHAELFHDAIVAKGLAYHVCSRLGNDAPKAFARIRRRR